jgi:hypothetical protein
MRKQELITQVAKTAEVSQQKAAVGRFEKLPICSKI